MDKEARQAHGHNREQTPTTVRNMLRINTIKATRFLMSQSHNSLLHLCSRNRYITRILRGKSHIAHIIDTIKQLLKVLLPYPRRHRHTEILQARSFTIITLPYVVQQSFRFFCLFQLASAVSQLASACDQVLTDIDLAVTVFGVIRLELCANPLNIWQPLAHETHHDGSRAMWAVAVLLTS